MAFPVVLDACVLVPHPLFDTLLRLADADLFRPLWSEHILDEVQRTLIGKLGLSEARARHRVEQMRRAFPDAMVKGHESLIPVMTNDPKDRHVLAVGVRAGASMIVTANTKDFPESSTGPYDVEVVHPDDFLLNQLDLDPVAVMHCLREQHVAYRKPAFTIAEFYGAFVHTVPSFAAHAMKAEVGSRRAQLPPGQRQDEDQLPLPLEVWTDEEAESAFFPNGEPDLGTPLGVAFLWWTALQDIDEYSKALRNLTYAPDAWDRFRDVSLALKGYSLAQNVHPYEEDPERVVFVKFLPGLESSVRAFGPAEFENPQLLTLVLDPDGSWKVWGIRRDTPATYAEVVGP